ARADLERHLASCAPCQARLASLRRAREQLATLVPPDGPTVGDELTAEFVEGMDRLLSGTPVVVPAPAPGEGRIEQYCRLPPVRGKAASLSLFFDWVRQPLVEPARWALAVRLTSQTRDPLGNPQELLHALGREPLRLHLYPAGQDRAWVVERRL